MLIEVIDDLNLLHTSHIQLIEDVIRITAQELNLPEQSEVDVTIVDNEEIHRLNLEYRNIDRPTDVLSFALTEGEDEDYYQQLVDEGIGYHLGDIIISYPKIEEQAQDYGHSFERELGFLTVHGFLHLNGYDHQTPDEEAEMVALQNEVLDKYGLTR